MDYKLSLALYLGMAYAEMLFMAPYNIFILFWNIFLSCFGTFYFVLEYLIFSGHM